MPYEYQKEKATLLTEDGQQLLILGRDAILDAIRVTGAITMGRATDIAMTAARVGACDNWTLMAVVDRLVELGDLREVSTAGYRDRIFVKG